METSLLRLPGHVHRKFPTRWEDYLNGNIDIEARKREAGLFPTRWEDYLNGNDGAIRRRVQTFTPVSHSLGRLFEWKPSASSSWRIGIRFPTRWEDYLNGNPKGWDEPIAGIGFPLAGKII